MLALKRSKNFKWMDDGVPHNLTVIAYYCPSCNKEINASPRESEAALNCEHCNQELEWEGVEK